MTEDMSQVNQNMNNTFNIHGEECDNWNPDTGEHEGGTILLNVYNDCNIPLYLQCLNLSLMLMVRLIETF